MGKIITFANQKGGSGKTTLSANLAVLWANSNYKVAVIDADAQRSLTNWLEARKKYYRDCLLYTSPSPRDRTRSRMPSSA